MQGLVVRINFDAHRFQGGHSQQWFGICLAEYNGSPDEFSHEFDLCCGDIHSDFAAVGEAVYPLSFGSKTNGLQVLPWDQAVRCTGVHQEKTLPDSLRFSEVPDRGSHPDSSHCAPPRPTRHRSVKRQRTAACCIRMIQQHTTLHQRAQLLSLFPLREKVGMRGSPWPPVLLPLLPFAGEGWDEGYAPALATPRRIWYLHLTPP